MTTDEKISKLAGSVSDVASELAFALRHISNLKEIILSDKARIESAADRIERLGESISELRH